MKNIFNLKAGVILSLLLFLISNLNANTNHPYILSDDGLIDARAMQKIYEIGNEAQEKLGSKIYLYAKKDYGFDDKDSLKKRIELIKEYEKNIIKNLTGSYVLMTMSVDQTHVNLIVSDDLKQIVDKNDVLNGYVVPLLASKDKNKLLSKTSAAMLNGYAQIADSIAESKGLKLESSIGSQGKTAGTIWKVFMYFLVLGGLLLYTYAILKNKKK